MNLLPLNRLLLSVSLLSASLLSSCSYTTEPGMASEVPSAGKVMFVNTYGLTSNFERILDSQDTMSLFYRPVFGGNYATSYGGNPGVNVIVRGRGDTATYSYLPYGDVAVTIDTVRLGPAKSKMRWMLYPYGSKVQSTHTLIDTVYSLGGNPDSEFRRHQLATLTVDFEGPGVVYTVGPAGTPSEMLHTLNTRVEILTRTQDSDSVLSFDPYEEKIQVFEAYSPKYNTIVQRQTMHFSTSDTTRVLEWRRGHGWTMRTFR